MTDRSWPREKLGRTARIGNGSTPRRDSTIYWSGGNLPWLNSAVVNESRVTRAEQFVTAVALRECHLPVVAPGSILVGLTGQGKTRGMATILDIEATLNQHVAYVTPDRSRWFPEYLLWSLRAVYDELRCLSEENGSTKGGLTCEALKQFRLAAPPLGEQRRIAAYLDKQTVKIDTLIEEQQCLIALLRERRQAVIERATATGGVTPPSEWRRTTLRRIGRFVTGTTPSGEPDEVFAPDGQLAWARPEDLGAQAAPSRHLSALGAMQVRPTRDAVLVCCIGATVGKVGWADGLIASNQQITAIEVDGSTKYWYYALMGSRSALIALAVGNTIPILNNTRLAELEVAVPPAEEQRRLVAYLDDQTSRIDTLITETERFVELSKERRAALITAAVTGQIDVREVA